MFLLKMSFKIFHATYQSYYKFFTQKDDLLNMYCMMFLPLNTINQVFGLPDTPNPHLVLYLFAHLVLLFRKYQAPILRIIMLLRQLKSPCCTLTNEEMAQHGSFQMNCFVPIIHSFRIKSFYNWSYQLIIHRYTLLC